MEEPCLMEILDLPEETLKRAIPKVSAHSLVRLVAAYPRAAGRSLLEIMSSCMSRPTITFIHEELHNLRTPTYAQIRAAEKELMNTVLKEAA